MIWPWLVVSVVAVGLSGVFSACEMGLYCLNPIRLELARRSRKRSATALSRTLSDREGLITVLLIGNSVVDYVATACLVFVLVSVGVHEQESELYTMLILTPIVFVFGEVLPKNLVRSAADGFMQRMAAPLAVLSLAFRLTGAVALLKWFARVASRCVGIDSSAPLGSLEPRQRLRAMLREGVLSDQQSAMVDRVMDLSRVRVRSAMVDRSRVVWVPVDAGRQTVDRLARLHSYSRMPVLSRSDRVVGVINILDVLGERAGRAIMELMAPPLEIPADQGVTAALTMLQRRGAAMAIVTDANGRFLGIVTIKDLVEEIVGDLQAW